MSSSAAGSCRSLVTISPWPPRATRLVWYGPTNATPSGRPTPLATTTARTWPATRRPAAHARRRSLPASTAPVDWTRTSTRRLSPPSSPDPAVRGDPGGRARCGDLRLFATGWRRGAAGETKTEAFPGYRAYRLQGLQWWWPWPLERLLGFHSHSRWLDLDGRRIHSWAAHGTDQLRHVHQPRDAVLSVQRT